MREVLATIIVVVMMTMWFSDESPEKIGLWIAKVETGYKSYDR